MSNDSPSIVHGELLSNLAPGNLPNFRLRRYQGDHLCLPVSDFTKDDGERLFQLYHWLQGLMDTLSAEREFSALANFLRHSPLSSIFALVRELGRSSLAANPSSLLAKTLHDVRGGALAGILAQLELAEATGRWVIALEALYFLSRDHLKIMRNALLGLDDAKRDEDLRTKPHGTDLIVEKWQGAEPRGQRAGLRVEVECPHMVTISQSCVEFAALDRILYNLINNACRHAFSERIRLTLLPVPDAEGPNLRFVVENTLSPQDLEHLGPMDLRGLFEEGASTTGSGYGLTIVAEFVCHAFGLSDRRAAIGGGYLGAALVEGSFAAWFHWPRVLED